MKSIMKKGIFILCMAIVLIVLAPRCSKLNENEPNLNDNEVPVNETPPVLSRPATLYLVNCAQCHGPLESSGKIGSTVPRLKTAIDNDIGGMGGLSSLTTEELQSIVSVLNPEGTPAPTPTPTSTPTSPPPTDGAGLYTLHCASCHGALATSRKKGMTLTRLQNAIVNNIGNMGYLSSLTSGEQQNIVIALNPIIVQPTPTPVPTLTPIPIPTPVVDGVGLYNANCAACHGALDVSRKRGITITRLHNAIVNDAGGMGFLSTLTSAEEQAIVTALIPSSSPTPTPTPTVTQTPRPTPTPVVDGVALYNTNCAGCHGALDVSRKKGTTLTRLHNAIVSDAGGMGFLSTLTSAEEQAIVAALTPSSTPTPIPTSTSTPTPTPTVAKCGSCHAIPPNVGRHSKHKSLSCSKCHGAGYTSTAVTAATHMNGVKNVAASAGWTPGSRTCTNACHGKESWGTQTSTPAPTPTPTPAPTVTQTPTPTPTVAKCGSCHAIPPSSGRHSKHQDKATCSKCHGTGYSSTAVSAATHMDGIKNIASNVGWTQGTRTCTNSCHGKESW